MAYREKYEIINKLVEYAKMFHENLENKKVIFSMKIIIKI